MDNILSLNKIANHNESIKILKDEEVEK